MKVQVGNKVYDSKKQPVMAIFTPWEKVLFPRMLRAPGKTRLAGFPAKFNRRKALKWAGSIVPLRRPHHGPRLSPKRMAQVSILESLAEAGVLVRAHRTLARVKGKPAAAYGYVVEKHAKYAYPGGTAVSYSIHTVYGTGVQTLDEAIAAGLGMLSDDSTTGTI